MAAMIAGDFGHLESRLWQWLRLFLHTDNHSTRRKSIATEILKLADHYKNDLGQTPWDQPDCVRAYLAYFLPRNLHRLRAVLELAQQQGPESLWSGSVFEVGSGPGTFEMAYCVAYNKPPAHYEIFETHPTPVALHRRWRRDALGSDSAPPQRSDADAVKSSDTLVLSYVNSELSSWPQSWWRAQHIVILEPSRRHLSRRLLQLRQQALTQGHWVWAPCTHQSSCPMLAAKDWCHDFITWQPPGFLAEIYQHLPMKSENLAFSYLILSRESPPTRNQWARVVGDRREEKGKTRQMICRGPQREFLAQLKRTGVMSPIKRGDVLANTDWPKAGENELRVSDPLEILWRRK